MNQIAITGSVAGGKTTFAKALSEHTGIRYYQLDSIVYAGEGRSRYKRTLKEQIHLEPCLYQSDFTMLLRMYRWTKEFERGRPEFTATLEKHGEKLIILKNPKKPDPRLAFMVPFTGKNKF